MSVASAGIPTSHAFVQPARRLRAVAPGARRRPPGADALAAVAGGLALPGAPEAPAGPTTEELLSDILAELKKK